MSALDLMLGTRRLRRKIEQQALQLHCDIENERLARAHFRQTFVARATSPLGLLSAVGAGFVAGKIGGRSSNSNRTEVDTVADTVSSTTTSTFAAIRAAAIQMALPMIIEWVQSKFAHRENNETPDITRTQDDSLPSD